MVKETARKCSHCGQNGHNSRTCNGNGKGKSCVKIFGVNICMQEEPENTLKKSFSMGNLECRDAGNIAESSNFPVDDGYLSEGHIHSKKNRAARERKRGKPWTDEEHRIFLTGLRKLGKGDWRGIAKNFVTTRTPTQVASHAQKYFLRQAGNDIKKKRRASLFDMAFHEHNGSSPHSPSKEISGNTCQINEQSQIVNRFPHLCLNDRAIPFSSVPTYYQNVQPMMVGVPQGQCFPVPFLPEIKYAQTLGNILVCAPAPTPAPTPISAAAHPSGIPSSPRSGSVQHGPITASTAEKDLLELKIGLPQSPKNSSQAFISVN